MREYCVYTQDPNFVDVLEWLTARGIAQDRHLNRTRFHLTESQLVELLLQYATSVYRVLPEDDVVITLA